MNFRRSLNWNFGALVVVAGLCGLAFASQAGREYHDLNKELNVTCQKVLAIITASEDRQSFMEAQRAWIGFRDANVAFHGRYFPGSKGGLFVSTEMTQERIKELKMLLADDAKHEHEKPFPNETNGDCYEKFQITIPESISVVMVPPKTTVHRQEGTLLVGHLKKTLLWAGHPGDKKMSIDDERAEMGVAIKVIGRTLHLAIFGAWHSFEGGSSASIRIGIPAGVSVRYAKGQPDNRTAEKLTEEGWLVVPSCPALKQDYDRLVKQ